jgi:gamma-glutamylcyclotransferase (GGCT)/AIG2-like uncharacterized protein YtfP
MNHLIFTYGSMMHPEEMRRRCRLAVFRYRAVVRDHQIYFPRSSKSRGGGVAGIQPAAGSIVWGIVWEITPAELVILDRAEGFRSGSGADRNSYVRSPITVLRENESSAVKAVEFYDAISECKFNRPSAAYLQLIIDGGRSHGLPESYLLAVRAAADKFSREA